MDRDAFERRHSLAPQRRYGAVARKLEMRCRNEDV